MSFGRPTRSVFPCPRLGVRGQGKTPLCQSIKFWTDLPKHLDPKISIRQGRLSPLPPCGTPVTSCQSTDSTNARIARLMFSGKIGQAAAILAILGFEAAIPVPASGFRVQAVVQALPARSRKSLSNRSLRISICFFLNRRPQVRVLPGMPVLPSVVSQVMAVPSR